MNSDSLFSADELIAKDSTGKKELVSFSFTMPEVDKIGETNLRVLLSSESKDDACDIYPDDYGEYEDYCVVLAKEAGCDVSKIVVDTADVGAHSIRVNWNNPEDLSGFYLDIKKKGDTISNGIERFVSDTTVAFFNLDTCTDYQIYFVPYCSDIERGLAEVLDVKTDCNVQVDDIVPNSIKIYPNPIGDILYVEGIDKSKTAKLEIVDLYGRIIFSKKYKGQSTLDIHTGNLLLPGFYILKLQQGKYYFSHKIIKL